MIWQPPSGVKNPSGKTWDPTKRISNGKKDWAVEEAPVKAKVPKEPKVQPKEGLKHSPVKKG